MADREPRDLVGDPQYYGIDQPGDYPEFEGQTWAEYQEHRNKWREWSYKQQDAVEKLVKEAAQQGIGSTDALNRAGFHDVADQGKYMHTLFGDNGIFATQGAAVDPNLIYDWARGIKTWKPGTDNAGQSIPINPTEWEEYRKAQKYRAAGLKGFGQQENASEFERIRGQHFTLDPTTGIWSNQGLAAADDLGNWDYKDQYGRSVKAPKGYVPPGAYGNQGSPQAPGQKPNMQNMPYEPQGTMKGQPWQTWNPEEPTYQPGPSQQPRKRNLFANVTQPIDDPLDPRYSTYGRQYTGNGSYREWDKRDQTKTEGTGLGTPNWFNSNDYLEQNPDVKAAGVDPWQHYQRYGKVEGRELGPKKAQMFAY